MVLFYYRERKEKMNTKLRLKNKVTLFSLIALAITLVYQVLAVFGIAPKITEEALLEVAGIILNLLVALGVLVDPTTEGIGDSTQALNYKDPRPKTIASDAVYSNNIRHLEPSYNIPQCEADEDLKCGEAENEEDEDEEESDDESSSYEAEVK